MKKINTALSSGNYKTPWTSLHAVLFAVLEARDAYEHAVLYDRLPLQRLQLGAFTLPIHVVERGTAVVVPRG